MLERIWNSWSSYISNSWSHGKEVRNQIIWLLVIWRCVASIWAWRIINWMCYIIILKTSYHMYDIVKVTTLCLFFFDHWKKWMWSKSISFFTIYSTINVIITSPHSIYLFHWTKCKFFTFCFLIYRRHILFFHVHDLFFTAIL